MLFNRVLVSLSVLTLNYLMRTCNAACITGDIRLRDGATSREGRVEVCYNNAWGTVCDDLWSTNDANVACRQLGFVSIGATALTGSRVVDGTGQIVLDNLRCTGNESRLVDCSHNGLGVHNCRHSYDAGVRCSAVCTEGSIRLMDGATSLEGRVEVCYNNAWGTVCDNLWSTNAANVACRQLGFRGTGATALSGFSVRDGTGQILLDNLGCTGNELRLVDCSHNKLGVHNCRHSDDAGVRCSAGCSAGSIRLRDGATIHEGRVEVCYNNAWGTVCDDLWSTSDANVACRQLGFRSTGATTLTGSRVVDGTGQIVLDNLRCTGRELRLVDCIHRGLGRHNCGHSDDAGVRCLLSIGTTCTQGDVRLVGSRSSSTLQGRVEFCNNNHWGTVCNDRWGLSDARVVCRQLGYSGSGAVALTSGFTQGSGSIWLDEVRCSGSESRLAHCPASPIGIHDCGHSEDAGVRCQRSPTISYCFVEGDVRLVGGTTNSEGRVEYCHNGEWGTVCDDRWDDFDATVVCRQLNLLTKGARALTSGFTNGRGRIWLDEVRCSGSEFRLASCRSNVIVSRNCGHSEDAGVRCGAIDCFEEGAVRLVGGTTSSHESKGRVEYCHNNEWGTVCDDRWDDADATVVCRQLNLPTTGARALTSGFTNGRGTIWLDEVRCSGSESWLGSCRSNVIGSHDCGHSKDAGVRCGDYCSSSGDVRLVGGASSSEGRVEYCYNNEWGTVCDNGWDDIDATVVCRQLGLSTSGARALMSGFTDGNGSIWLDEVRCSGSESRLASCRSFRTVRYDCRHSEDAGVRCGGTGLSSAQAGGIAAGVTAAGVIAFIGCVIALIVGVACYKKGVCKTSSLRSSQTRSNGRTPVTAYPLASYPTVGSNTMNSGYYVTTAPQVSLNGTHVLNQQPQRPYQPQHPATLTLEEPPHLKEATTHAGEAPPAYHAATLYQTMTLEDYKSLKLSEPSADNGAKADLSSNTDAPPSYSEIIGGQEENSVTPG